MIGRALLTGLAYYVTARLSLRLSLVGESVTPLWPPTGIALVGFLWFGYRIWPGVALAAFLVNLPISPTVGAAAGIAVGNTLAPLLARRLLEFLRFRSQIDRFRDALSLVFVGALAGMTVSATAGTTSLLSSGAIPAEDYASTWLVWWTGDAMGILAVAPFLLSLRLFRIEGPPRTTRAAEATALFLALGGATFAITRTHRPVWVLIFPLLGWAAWRFQQRGAGPAAILVIVAATWSAANQEGPFAGGSLVDRMVMLQTFNAAVSFTSFFFAAIVAERLHAESDRRRALDRERRAQERLYEREHGIAETLQRSLLPETLETFPDVRAVARYVPAADDLLVGGDWYDVVELPDGRMGVAIGDVAGHGVGAAAAMGQLRTAFRAYLLEGFPPAEILERLNGFLINLEDRDMTTAVCAVLDPETGSLGIARAGHPPPLMWSSGNAAFVEAGLGPPLGVAPSSTYEGIETELPTGATLILYTDGLVERRGESLAQGLTRLRSALEEAPDGLDAVCDRIVGRLMGTGERADDAALLAIRRETEPGRPFFLRIPSDARRIPAMRRHLGRWLRRNGFADEASSEILVAVTEACANAVQHAYELIPGLLEIGAGVEAGEAVLVVRDFGTWKTRSVVAGEGQGRGLVVIRGLMDAVDLVTDALGTTVTMRRRDRDG